MPHHQYCVSLSDISTVIELSIHQHEFLYQIDTRFKEDLSLNPFGFTQYAQTQCTFADFYQFFYASPTSEDKKVIKCLRKLLTPKKIEEYTKIALYPLEGYGTYHQPVKWHERMAKFLDEIIDSNEVICNYVDGLRDDKEIIISGTEITFFRKSVAINFH